MRRRNYIKIIFRPVAIFMALIGFILLGGIAAAQDGKALFEAKKCGECHKIAGPAPKTIAEAMARKGPDLFYAGSKFKGDWLIKWLQKPDRLRPAGLLFLNHVKSGPGGDEVDEGSLKPHPALSADEAKAVGSYLMSLKDQGLKSGLLSDAKLNRVKAKLLFEKQGACHSCHQVKVRDQVVGGKSCPELYDVGERLSPDWIYSFIKNPQYWDPKIWMPNMNFKDEDVDQLTKYIISFGK